MKKFLLVIFVSIAPVVFAQKLDTEEYRLCPSVTVDAVNNLYTNVISPSSEFAVLSFNWINIYFFPTSIGRRWALYMTFENTTDQQVYMNFPRATALVDGRSAHLYYKRSLYLDDMTAYAFELMPHSFSYSVYVQPNILLSSKNLKSEANRHGVNQEDSKHYVTFYLPVMNAETLETETCKIEFEVMWVNKKFLKEKDFFLPEKGPFRSFYYPRTAYEALQNKPIPEK